MNPPPSHRAEGILEAALSRDFASRECFISQACEGDPVLLAEIRELLAAHEAMPSGFLGPPAATESSLEVTAWQTPASKAPPDLELEKPGDTIGLYKLRERIGEGGFGTVWVADQEKPMRRRVALKIVKLGMDTKDVIARFEQERQALAMMDHPNIAKILDAGVTQWGRPFFVMELVRGLKITDYCDEQKLSTEERVALFITVCQAVQHAHQKGIIHRDIKPSNILVTINDGKAVPKVIDFGVAKATQGRLTDATVYTQFQQMIGTPLYMSPEQADLTSLDVDTRSDIYSLGVLLYELLTGRTPIDSETMRMAGLDEMRRMIRELDPPRPSMRLKTLAAAEMTTAGQRRNTEPAKLEGTLRGDIDWIVMKCLEKDRGRRYDTANGLALDLQRHLKNEVVVARPPTAAYLLSKLIRRNKLAFAAGAAIAASLVIGIAVSVWQAVRATRAEKEAVVDRTQALTEKANAQAALRFIQDEVLSQASPGYQPDRELTVRALLDRIAGRLDGASKRPPLVEASIRQTLGSVYTELGDYAKAIEHYQAALRVQREHLGERHLETLRTLNGLATAHWWGGEPSLAEPLTRQGLEASHAALGEKHPLTLQFMLTRAFIMMGLAEKPWTEVEALFLKSLALHREILGPDDAETLRTMMGLSMGYLEHEQPAKAEPLLVDALDRSRRVLGESHPITIGLIAIMAANYDILGQLDKAEALASRAVELHRGTLGADHPLGMANDCLLAGIYVAQKEFDKARPLTDQALNLGRRLPLEKCAISAGNLSRLGWNYLEQGDVAQADLLCVLAWQAMRRNPAFYPVGSPQIIVHLGAVRLAQQQHAEAETLLREGLRLTEKHDLDAGWRLHVMNLLGASLAGQKKFAEAEPLLLQSGQALQQRQSSLAPYWNPSRRIAESFERLVQLYDAWGKPAEAAEWKTKLAAFQQAHKAVEKKGAKS